ncbi:MAG: DUF2334 domain-containing protein [archaeon]
MRSAIVSIHDVAPVYKKELETICSNLSLRNIEPRNWLVIPNYAGQSILEDAVFVSWLNVLQGKGDELVMHGCTHRSSERTYDTRWKKWKGEYFADGCGEFQQCTYTQAKSRLHEGRMLLEQAGIATTGFVAPAWLLNAQAERAAWDVGVSYIAGLARIKERDKARFVPTIGLTSRQDGSRVALRTYATCMQHWPGDVQVAIHPQDVNDEEIMRCTYDFIEQMRKHHRLVTYATFVSSGEYVVLPNTSSSHTEKDS